MSGSDSIFVSPRNIHLKKQVNDEKSKKDKCKREILKLKRQNKYVKCKTASLRVFKKKSLNKENFDEVTKKTAGSAHKEFLRSPRKEKPFYKH